MYSWREKEKPFLAMVVHCWGFLHRAHVSSDHFKQQEQPPQYTQQKASDADDALYGTHSISRVYLSLLCGMFLNTSIRCVQICSSHKHNTSSRTSTPCNLLTALTVFKYALMFAEMDAMIAMLSSLRMLRLRYVVVDAVWQTNTDCCWHLSRGRRSSATRIKDRRACKASSGHK